MSNGTLYRQIKQKGNLCKELIRKIFYETALAVNYAHQHNIILRDLKPENILLDQNFHVKSKFKYFNFFKLNCQFVILDQLFEWNIFN